MTGNEEKSIVCILYTIQTKGSVQRGIYVSRVCVTQNSEFLNFNLNIYKSLVVQKYSNIPTESFGDKELNTVIDWDTVSSGGTVTYCLLPQKAQLTK